MKWFDSARTRLRLVFARRTAESRMNHEFRFHIEMETDRLMRAKGLAFDDARRQALAAFGGVEKHKEAMRDGRGLAWLSGLSLDLKLAVRMLVKFPGLTVAGGLALAVAIAIGAGFFDLTGKLFDPTIPLPEGDRLVVIETQNILTNRPEPRVARDFLEWRRELRTIEELGAYRTDTRSLAVGSAMPEPIVIAELTATAFRTARVAPQLGRALLDSDERPGAPAVVIIGYDIWQRAFGGRPDVVGSLVKMGNTPTTVIGVMPEGFGYPFSHHAWTPLSLRASYEALEGGSITVLGRLAPGVSKGQADAEVRVMGERASAALPATHQHLRPRVLLPWEESGEEDFSDIVAFAMMNLPGLIVLGIACLTVGTLTYARTATREGEIALRSALGASRARVIGQLFVEALVLALIAAAIGLVAADWTLRWGIEEANRGKGGTPFWMAPGLNFTTVLYACGLAVVSAAMLSVLPALKATHARVQSNLANLGTGGSTLRFGRVWTSMMIAQVALTAIGIPIAMEGANETGRTLRIRAGFPSREYLAARIDVDRPFDEQSTPAFEQGRARAFAALEQRMLREPGVIAVTYADRAPGERATYRSAEIEASPGAGPKYSDGFATLSVGPGFFETFDRPIVAGRAFHGGDWSPDARTVIVNEAFAHVFSRETGRGTPVGARFRYPSSSARSEVEGAPAAAAAVEPWFEIVGVVRDFGLHPNEGREERAFVFHPASAGTVTPFVMSVRVRGNPGALAARLPVIAAEADERLYTQESRSLEEWIRAGDSFEWLLLQVSAGITALVLFLSALGIFSLMSVTVSRRTREIGLRVALGARPHHVMVGILSKGIVLMGSGIIAGGALVLLVVANGGGPTGQAAEDVPLFAMWVGMTAVVMLTACVLACIGPARRALGINPTEALRDS